MSSRLRIAVALLVCMLAVALLSASLGCVSEEDSEPEVSPEFRLLQYETMDAKGVASVWVQYELSRPFGFRLSLRDPDGVDTDFPVCLSQSQIEVEEDMTGDRVHANVLWMNKNYHEVPKPGTYTLTVMDYYSDEVVYSTHDLNFEGTDLKVNDATFAWVWSDWADGCYLEQIELYVENAGDVLVYIDYLDISISGLTYRTITDRDFCVLKGAPYGDYGYVPANAYMGPIDPGVYDCTITVNDSHDNVLCTYECTVSVPERE